MPGTGLPMPAYLVLVTASVAVFLLWNGLLWRAPREASHVARFVISYAAVVPLAALLLLALHRFTWSRLITATGSAWAIKLVVTAVLYQAFARGTATHLEAAAPPAPPRSSASAELSMGYRPTPAFEAGGLRGVVSNAGAQVGGAVVFLDAPAPGRPAPPRATIDLEIRGSRYAQALYVARDGDDVRVVNRDSVLHTVHFHGPGSPPPNVPVPPSGEPRALELPYPGVYQIRCDMHPDETAWMVITDHPYVTRTTAAGAFTLEGVPVGEARVVAVHADALGIHRAERRVTVRAGLDAEATITFDP